MKRDILMKTTCPEEKVENQSPKWKQDKVLKWLDELAYPEKLCEVRA